MWFQFAVIALLMLAVFSLILLLFDYWTAAGVLIVLFSIATIIISGFWYSDNKTKNLSLVWPVISIVIAVIFIIAGIFIIVIGFRGTSPGIIEFTPIPEEPVLSHDQCQSLLDQRDQTGKVPFKLLDDTQRYNNCISSCVKNPNIPNIRCFDQCQRGSCQRYPDLAPRLQ